VNKPWWWVINPWLYSVRIARAYREALNIIEEDGRQIRGYVREVAKLRARLDDHLDAESMASFEPYVPKR